MNKPLLRKYAADTRIELINKVKNKATLFGITKDGIADNAFTDINGNVLSELQQKEREYLIKEVERRGYDSTMEEAAYIWFNRFTAIRFMEVNGFLPQHVKIFTNDENKFKPQIIREALTVEIDGLDKDYIFKLKNENKNEELFQYLIVKECKELGKILPGVFGGDLFADLLIPDNLLREGSVIQRMIDDIPENDWKDQVQIIGWLYQYYNSQLKNEVAGTKINKNTLAPATQLFTPDWIVKYMVDNSLGRLWNDYSNENMRISEFEYYLSNDSQNVNYDQEFDLTDIKCIDPCMGSGHVLCYLFDVLVQMYERKGFTKQETVKNIISKNLWGMDVDDRAAQLAYFSVMMKARNYDRRFFTYNITPNIISIKESNSVSNDLVEYFVNGDSEVYEDISYIMNIFNDAKEYGTLIAPHLKNSKKLKERIEALYNEESLLAILCLEEIVPLVKQALVLDQKYEIVVTNPPYLGRRKSMNSKLTSFLDRYYPEGKMDLFAAFISRNCDFLRQGGYAGFMTPYVWLYLNSYVDLRKKIMNEIQIQSLVQLEKSAFSDAAVSICSFVMRKKVASDANYAGTFLNLEAFSGEDIQPIKVKEAILNQDIEYRYERTMNYFEDIPDYRFVFWINEKTKKLFSEDSFEKTVAVKQGITTSDNERFLRYWFEVEKEKIGFNETSESAKNNGKKWFPYSKGGENRRWYGNNEYVINYKNDGEELKAFHEILNKTNPGGRLKNKEYYFRKSITWSDICGTNFAARANAQGFLFDVKGSSAFVDDEIYYYILSFMNTKLVKTFCNMLNPSVTTQVGDIKQIPLIIDRAHIDEVNLIAEQCIAIAKADWDDYELSWDFVCNPLVRLNTTGRIEDAYQEWDKLCKERMNELIINENKLNAIFADIYGFEEQDFEKTIEDDITLHRAELQVDIKLLISYAVGCMLGRFYQEALGHIEDADNIIPICEDEYFADDIVTNFVLVIEKLFGSEHLEENLKFIADALGGQGSSRAVIRRYFVNSFFDDHVKMYSKRPIYWQFDAGKKNSFKGLIYIQRYKPDTIARIRTDYIHELQSRYETSIDLLKNKREISSGNDKVKESKIIKDLQDKAVELHTYEEKIHHLADQMISIDLDDGVKKNYEIFKDVLAKIK